MLVQVLLPAFGPQPAQQGKFADGYRKPWASEHKLLGVNVAYWIIMCSCIDKQCRKMEFFGNCFFLPSIPKHGTSYVPLIFSSLRKIIYVRKMNVTHSFFYKIFSCFGGKIQSSRKRNSHTHFGTKIYRQHYHLNYTYRCIWEIFPNLIYFFFPFLQGLQTENNYLSYYF